MANAEMPQMYASARASSAYVPDGGAGLVGAGGGGDIRELTRRMAMPAAPIAKAPQAEDTHMNRIVQIYIADTYDSIPLDKRLLYTGEPFFTDLTDQELFFTLDVNGILKKHNEYRVTVLDKRVLGRPDLAGTKLEPARVRDLKMVVVTVVTL